VTLLKVTFAGEVFVAAEDEGEEKRFFSVAENLRP